MITSHTPLFFKINRFSSVITRLPIFQTGYRKRGAGRTLDSAVNLPVPGGKSPTKQDCRLLLPPEGLIRKAVKNRVLHRFHQVSHLSGMLGSAGHFPNPNPG